MPDEFGGFSPAGQAKLMQLQQELLPVARRKPGYTPEKALEEVAPEVSFGTRAKLQYTSLGPEDIVRGLKKEGLEAVPDGNRVAVKSPKTGHWHYFDPDKAEWADITDAIGDIQDTIFMIGGGIAGAEGGPVGSVAGAAGATAFSKGLRTESLRGAGEGAVEGAVGELGGRALSYLGGKAIQGVKKAVGAAGSRMKRASDLLKTPETLREIEARGQQIAADEANVAARASRIDQYGRELGTREAQLAERGKNLGKTKAEISAEEARIEQADLSSRAQGKAMGVEEQAHRADQAGSRVIGEGVKTAETRLGEREAQLGAEKAATGQGRAQEKARESFYKEDLGSANAEVQALQQKYAAETRERLANLDATIEAGRKVTSTPLAEAAGKLKELGGKARPGSSRAVLSDILDPAYGTRADVLELVPELREIGQRWFGLSFRNEFGASAMNVADRQLKVRPGYDQELQGWSSDIANWLLGPGGPKMSALQKKGVISVAQKRATAEDIKAFQAALHGRITKATTLERPDLAGALQRQAQSRAAGTGARGQTLANEIAYTSDDATQARMRRGIAESEVPLSREATRAQVSREAVAKQAEGIETRKIPLSAEEARVAGMRSQIQPRKTRLADDEARLAADQAGIAGRKTYQAGKLASVGAQKTKLDQRVSIMKGDLAGIPIPRQNMAKGVERLAGAGLGAVAGAPFGLAGPGAVVGALGADVMAKPLAIAGRAIDWLRLKSPQVARALVMRAPRAVRGPLQQLLEVLQKHGPEAAKALAATLIKSNPELENAIDSIIP